MLLSIFKLDSQNLLPNGDFENYISLPTSIGDWHKCSNWTNVNGVIGSSPYGTPDYLHTQGATGVGLPNNIFATVMPFSGNAIMGFVTYSPYEWDFREYLSSQLLSPMIIGEKYTISFWLTNGASNYYNGYSSDRLGVKLSTNPMFQLTHEPLNVYPTFEILGQVWSNDWVNYTFTIIADSAYNHFTIGNFYYDFATTTVYQVNSTLNTSYYFIDKVEIMQDDSISPNTPVNIPNQIINMPNVFSPNNDGINDNFHPVELEGITNSTMCIFNRWGEKIFTSRDLKKGWDGKCNNQNCDEGTYFWLVEYFDSFGKQKSLKGFLSILR